MINLPRQARDKHRKTFKKQCCFSGGSGLYGIQAIPLKDAPEGGTCTRLSALSALFLHDETQWFIQTGSGQTESDAL
eukprot:COSAG06_NODE_44_length_29699_cov_231.744527_21_plen_77_part_00